MVVRRQMDYAAARGVPWGISESAYNLVDRHGNYQYKAFGVPGLGLKRGLGDELVVAPYATALAVMIDPGREHGQPAAAGAASASRASTDSSTPSTTPPIAEPDARTPAGHARPAGVVVPTYLAHHEGMTLVALANALLGDRMVERFHAGAEGPGDGAAAAGARAAPRRRRSSRARSTRCASPRRSRRCRSAATARRTRCSRTRSSSRTATTSRR